MIRLLERTASKIWPGLADLPSDHRLVAALDISGSVYFFFFALLGVTWITFRSDWPMLVSEWVVVLFILVLLIPFNRLRFFVQEEIRPGMVSSVDNSLEGMLIWSAALMLGPVGLWFGVLSALVRLIYGLRREGSGQLRWSVMRNELSSIADASLPRMLGLTVYAGMGGVFPMPDLEMKTVGMALVATLLVVVAQQVMSVPLYLVLASLARHIDPSISAARLVQFTAGTSALLASGMPFAILAAGLYADYGLWLMLFFFSGMLVVSFLAHNLSRSALHSQQQTRLIEGLESLGRELLQAMPDEETLLGRIRDHILSSRLPLQGKCELRLFPDRVVVHNPESWTEPLDAAWNWLRQNPGLHFFQPDVRTPWGQSHVDRCTILGSIIDPDSGELLGGIYHTISTRGYFNPALVRMYLPVIDSLSDQVALSLRRVHVYQQTMAHQRVEQELRVAGDIQGGFLPNHFPEVEGWKLSGVLVSARDTSGDFFDLFSVDEGRTAIVVADVADKGVGAALYMALSRAYMRSQALEKDPQPAEVVTALNRRILSDTSSDLFVTMVYGLVCARDNSFHYCNAGHPPPLLVRRDSSAPAEFLRRTGMAVGVMPDSTWETATVTMQPGDMLVIYSDGITDARNDAGELYGVERLRIEAEGMRGRDPYEVRQHLLSTVQVFSGSEQEDDITMLVLLKT